MRFVSILILVVGCNGKGNDAPRQVDAGVEQGTVEELRELLAREGARDDKGVTAEGGAPGATIDCWPDEARGVLVCRHGRGRLRSHGELLDSPGDGKCYKACGPGCRGGCQVVQVGCAARGPSETVTRALPCFTYDTSGDGDSGPGEHDGRILVVPRKHFRSSPAACAATVAAPAGAGVTAVPGATLRVCTHAPCCASHDTCTRFDRGVALARCHVRGHELCGVSSLVGQPTQPWDLKWFDEDGWPVATAGHCEWSSGAPRWVRPPVVAMDVELVDCLVHAAKHAFPTWPPGGTPPPLEISLPTFVPAPP